MKSHIANYLPSNPIPCDIANNNRHFAAVALILTGSNSDDLSSLYIRRADNPKDPWSGQIGLPGGRVSLNDGNHKDTAARETFEEVGLTLKEANYCGYLGQFQAVRPGLPYEMYISTFVFYLPAKPQQLILQQSEVAQTLWRPLSYINDPKRKTQYIFENSTPFDAINLQMNIEEHYDPAPYVKNELLWGITYRMMNSFMATMNI